MRVLAALLVLALLLAGCSGGGPAETPTTTTTTPPTPSYPPPARGNGVALSPASGRAGDFSAFFDEARQVGNVVLWGGPPEQLADASSAPHVVAQLAREKGLAVAIQVSYVTEQGEKPFGDVDQARWRSDVVAFATKRHPEYLALGVEVDRFVAGHEAFFLEYAKWFNATYEAVKAVSPDTLVFVTYQYERTSGRTGGLYGGPELGPDRWSVLDLFAKADLVAFTTYPGLVMQDAGALPLDHYAAIREHTQKPVAFTEVGHFAALDKAPGWESSPEEQAAFARAFRNATAPLDPKLTVWLHLHDQPNVNPAPFKTMGLIDANGEKRAAYEVWARG